MICPLLITIDGNKSNLMECQRENCFFWDSPNKSCIWQNMHKYMIDMQLQASRMQKNVISTLNKNTDNLLFHQNESGRRIHQLMEDSTEHFIKTNQEMNKALAENSKRLQNMGSTLFGILSDQKDGRKQSLAQLGEIIRKIEEAIQAVQQAATDTRTAVEQYQEVFTLISENQNEISKDLIESVEKLTRKNDEILNLHQENSQSFSRHIQEVLDAVGSAVGDQAEMSDKILGAIKQLSENADQTREMIDRRLGEFLAAQRSFVATQIERSNEEVRLMSELYRSNRNVLDLMREAKENAEQKEQEKQLQKAEEHNEAGVEYFHKQAYEAAGNEFEMALELNPHLLAAKNNLALVYHRIGKTSKAIEKFEEVVEANGNFPEIYGNLGFCYYAQKKYPKAIEFFEKAIKIDDSYAPVFDGLAHSYYSINNTNKAIENWKRAYDLDPSLLVPKMKLELFQV